MIQLLLGRPIFATLPKEVDFLSKKRDLQKTAFSFFKDNLCNFSNDEFENNDNDLYSAELKLKKGN